MLNLYVANRINIQTDYDTSVEKYCSEQKKPTLRDISKLNSGRHVGGPPAGKVQEGPQLSCCWKGPSYTLALK